MQKLKWLILGLICCQSANTLVVPKNSYDTNEYASLVLSNGLKVLLIHDPKAEYSAAALNVSVGSHHDPKDRLGLAHFLEHMLFLGTKKYPDAASYSEFVHKHGGYENAWTSGTNTEYLIKINPKAFAEGLDRFSQFFIEPLFNPEFVEREINAVDSEYKLRLKQDSRRIFAAIRDTSNPKHPFYEFHVGSLETLSYDKDYNKLRDELLKFYKEHYSPNRMSLVLTGNQSISELKKLAMKNFSGIKTNITSVTKFSEQALGAEFNRELEVATIEDHPELSLCFKLPSQKLEYKHRSAEFLKYLLNQTHQHSLFYALKQKNWITALNASFDDITEEQDLFELNFSLTEDGKKHQDHITTLAFSYLNFIANAEPQALAQLFAELRKSNIIKANYRDKRDEISMASKFAGSMHYLPEEDYILAYEYTSLTEFSLPKFKELLQLFVPTNMLRLKASQDLVTNKVEQFYQVGYNVKPMANNLIKTLSNPQQEVEWLLPTDNELLPEKLDLVSAAEQKYPSKIVEKDNLIVWHKTNTTFTQPKVNVRILLKSEYASNTIENYIKQKLLVEILNDDLQIYDSKLNLAGISLYVYPSIQGLNLNLDLYSDKIESTLKLLTTLVKDPDLNEINFSRNKEYLLRQLQNGFFEPPYSQAKRVLQEHIFVPGFSLQTQIDALQKITIDDLRAYIKNMLSLSNLEMLFHGNILDSQSKKIALACADDFGIASNKKIKSKALKIRDFNEHAKIAAPFAIDHHDSATIKYYQLLGHNVEAVMYLELLHSMLTAPFYHELRTKQQLGYVVNSFPLEHAQNVGLGFLVESPVQPADYVLRMIDNFLRDFPKSAQEITKDQFKQFVAALKLQYEKKHKSLRDETTAYWKQILNNSYQFDFNTQKAKALKNAKFSEALAFYNKHILSLRNTAIVSVYTSADIKTPIAGYSLFSKTDEVK